jgi:uncharacterized protein YkwD
VSSRLFILALGFSILALPCISRADAVAALNAVRSRGCGAFAPHERLQISVALNQITERMSRGESYDSAKQSVHYRAKVSTALHLTGLDSDAEISQSIRAHYCRNVSEPGLREIGAARHGDQVWIVIAEPLTAPAQRDAALISTQILALVNQARSHERRCGAEVYPAAAPLRLAPALTRAAREHSIDMAQGEFEHRGGDGSTPAQRAQRAGYRHPSVIGENIAAGATSPREVVQGWLDSPGHCANMMDRRFRDLGIGFAVDWTSRFGIYWTLDLGSG